MRKSVALAVGAVVLAVVGAAAEAAEPVRVGFVAAITGPASFLGEPQKNTALMVQEWVNQGGGINGRPLEVVIEDSKSEESQAVLAVKKLIEKDRVAAVVGSSTTGESLAMAPICEKAQVPMISMAAALQIVTPAEEYKRIVESATAAVEVPRVQRPWIFKTAQTDSSAVEAIFAYMKGKGIARVGIVTVTAGFGDTGRKELKRLAPKYGIAVVADEVYGPKDADMTAQLTRIKASGAQAVVNWSIGPAQVVVTKNWAALAMGVPLYQSHGFGSRKNIELADGAAEGVLTPLGRLAVWDRLPPGHPQAAVLSRYAREYQQRYASEASTFGGHAYDALYMVADAAKEVGTDRGKIRDHLETRIKNWPGTAGVFTLTAADHTGLDHTAFEMIRVAKGDWEFADGRP